MKTTIVGKRFLRQANTLAAATNVFGDNDM
jgi:hypothetical protein